MSEAPNYLHTTRGLRATLSPQETVHELIRLGANAIEIEQCMRFQGHQVQVATDEKLKTATLAISHLPIEHMLADVGRQALDAIQPSDVNPREPLLGGLWEDMAYLWLNRDQIDTPDGFCVTLPLPA